MFITIITSLLKELKISEEVAFNMGSLMETACRTINGRGGGRPQQAQGGGPDVEKLENALQIAEDTLLNK